MTERGEVFLHTATEGFERLTFGHDAGTGLHAIVALHSTALGPGMGGTRFVPYATEGEAVTDVCRLAKGMSYKHAVSGLAFGGGKAVILGDPRRDRTDELIDAYGRFVDSLAGSYLTAEDVGTTQADMDRILAVTTHVTGASEALGGSGDPSPATAWGVRWALASVAERLWGRPDLAGRHVVVSGVGKVGRALVDHLVELGARVTVADVDPSATALAVEAHGVAVVAPEAAHTVACDVFSPCALGAVLSNATIPQLRCAAVCGSANNQLATDADQQRLADRGVLYAPDYVVNAGGVINIAEERRRDGHPYDRRRAADRVAGIADTLAHVFAAADRDDVTPTVAADRIAEARLTAASRSAPARSRSSATPPSRPSVRSTPTSRPWPSSPPNPTGSPPA